jgi:hypothetical protein
MIVAELLEENKSAVREGVNELFAAAESNQTHEQDILLVDQHGFYDELLAEPEVREEHELSPYVIGPHYVGHAEATSYEFIDLYRQSHIIDRDALQESLGNEDFERDERFMLEIEKSIYLKFWESDLTLKKLYQLSRLVNGESYDRHFSISPDPREGPKKHEIIRKKIRDEVEENCSSFYSAVKDNYKAQVRNAIAHSQYAFMGRSIHYLNYSEDPKAHCPIQSMPFDEWYDLFSKTILIHNELIRAFKEYRTRFREKALSNGNRLEVRITRYDHGEGLQDEPKIEYGHVGVTTNDQWVWHESLSDEDHSLAE